MALHFFSLGSYCYTIVRARCVHLVIVRLRGFRPPCCSPHEPWTVEAFRGTQKAKRVMLGSQQTQLTPLRSVRKVAVHSVVKISWCLCRFLRHPSIPYLQVHPRHAHVSPRSLPSPLCPSRCLTRPHAPQHPTSAGPSHPARLLSLRSTLPTPRAPPPRAGWMYHTTLGPDQRGNTRGPP